MAPVWVVRGPWGMVRYEMIARPLSVRSRLLNLIDFYLIDNRGYQSFSPRAARASSARVPRSAPTML